MASQHKLNLRALQVEEDAVTFIAKMIERIINAEVEKDELTSMSTLLLVLIDTEGRRWC